MKKSYVYTPSGQILYQCFADAAEPNEYFYVHDRLGSVRLVVEEDGSVENSYTYDPSGVLFTTETAENAENPFKFTGQWFDSEIAQYYLRARMYDPALMRFTGYDPVMGKNQNPLTLHKYLYCLNNSTNMIDPDGRFAGVAFRLLSGAVGSVIAGGVAAATHQDKIAIGAAMVSGFVSGFSMNMWVSAGMGAFSSGFSRFMAGGGFQEIMRDTALGAGIGLAGGAVAAKFTVGLGPELSGAVKSWTALGASSLGNLYGGALQMLYDVGYMTVEDWTEQWKEPMNELEEQLYGSQP